MHNQLTWCDLLFSHAESTVYNFHFEHAYVPLARSGVVLVQPFALSTALFSGICILNLAGNKMPALHSSHEDHAGHFIFHSSTTKVLPDRIHVHLLQTSKTFGFLCIGMSSIFVMRSNQCRWFTPILPFIDIRSIQSQHTVTHTHKHVCIYMDGWMHAWRESARKKGKAGEWERDA